MSIYKRPERFFAGNKVFESKTTQKIYDLIFKENEKPIKQLSRKQILKRKPIEYAVNSMWGKYDFDNQGYLTQENCQQIIEELLDKLGQKHLYRQDKLDSLFDSFDQNKKGQLDKLEITDIVDYIINPQDSCQFNVIDKQKTVLRRKPIEYALDSIKDQYDFDNQGYLTQENCQQIVEELLDKLGQKDLLDMTVHKHNKFEALFDSFDLNKKGLIHYQEIIDLVDFIQFENLITLRRKPIETLIDSMWQIFDTRNKGNLSKSTCLQILNEVLEIVGHKNLQNKDMFLKLFDQVDTDNHGVIQKYTVINLVDFVIYKDTNLVDIKNEKQE